MPDENRRVYDQQIFRLTEQLSANIAVQENLTLKLGEHDKSLRKIDKRFDTLCHDCAPGNMVSNMKKIFIGLAALCGTQTIIIFFMIGKKYIEKKLGL